MVCDVCSEHFPEVFGIYNSDTKKQERQCFNCFTAICDAELELAQAYFI